VRGLPYNACMPKQGLVLFAHGARDPRWAEAFDAVAERIRTLRPDLPVTLAFLDYLAPDLAAALRTQAAQGVDRVRLVPLFFGRGGHLREDFPVILEAARAAGPEVDVDVTEAAGESGAIQDALAQFALRGL
jgi:sirohydrochlorin cobaltochelatase